MLFVIPFKPRSLKKSPGQIGLTTKIHKPPQVFINTVNPVLGVLNKHSDS